MRGIAYLDPATGQIAKSDPRLALHYDHPLPPPARDLVDHSLYREAWLKAHGRFSLNAISSRGCPFRCNWCAKPIFGDNFRLNDAADVAEEMRILRDTHSADHVWFADDIFALNRHWVKAFAAEVENRNARVPFKIQARADLMSRETAHALASAGCEEAWMGVESGSQTVLDAMEKGLRVGDIDNARQHLREVGVRACYFLQLGFPGETWTDIRKTIDIVRQTKPDDIGVSLSYPLPNTRFHERVREQLGAKRNWSDSDDLCVMFKGDVHTTVSIVSFGTIYTSRLKAGPSRTRLHNSRPGRFGKKSRGPSLYRIMRTQLHSLPSYNPQTFSFLYNSSRWGQATNPCLTSSLLHGYFLQEDPKELQIMKPYVPLGILYICSHLRAKGIDVEVFDTTFSTRPELFSYLQSETPTILGVYANLMTRKNVVEILRVAHDAGWKTIVGGPEPGAYVDEYLRAGADVVVLGEGELTMEELVPVLGASHDLSLVAGIAYLDEHNQVQHTAPRAQIANLDAQPWPARDTVDVDRYVNTWRTAHGKGSASFITARGCPYKCRWCSHQVFGQTHRRRNPRLVVDEVEWLLNRYQPDMVWVADDVFTIHHGWLREYAAEMRKRSIHIPFECITRADRMNDESRGPAGRARLLPRLDRLRERIAAHSRFHGARRDGREVQRGVEMARSRGIASGMFLMWGYEGEELQDIEATIEHVKRSDPDVFFTTVAYPIKGTPYYDKISSQLLQIKPWTESSDRDLVVSGRHSKRFYDYADRLLQDEVQLARFERVGELNANGTELRNRISETRAALHASYAEVEA